MSHENPFQSPESSFEEERPRYATEYSGEVLNPWFSIWLRPRATIRYIVETDPTQSLWLVASLGGIAGSLQNAVSRENAPPGAEIGVVIGAFIGGAVGGCLAVLIVSALIRWTSGWLGGVATKDQMRAAVAWAYVPSIWGLLLWIPLIAMFGMAVITSDFWNKHADATHSLAILAFTGAHLVLAVWQLVIHCKTVGEVSEFSAWRAFGATILAGLLVLVPIILFVVAIGVAIGLRG